MRSFLQKNVFVVAILLIVSVLYSSKSFATHLRAGEITIKRISLTSLTYRVTLTTYTDQINGVAANDAANTYKIYFGVGSVFYNVQRRSKILVNPSTMVNVYDTVFTYPAQGTYTITCGIQNRNANTVNLPAPSDQLSFFVQTTVLISDALGLNHSPVLLNVPLDSGGVGKRFIHNPGAFDADGDSLAYRMTICKKDAGLNDITGVGIFIPGYQDPASIGTPPLLNQDGTGPATLKINDITGDLIWDAPRQKGQYNVAFIVEEHRKGLDGTYIKIGEITRDMQIIIVDDPNNPPVLTVPPNLCIEAGSSATFKVSATDKDNNNLKITSSSGVYNIDAAGGKASFIPLEAAVFSPWDSTQKNPAQGLFTWNTNCLHVRQQPYDVVFKVVDFPGRFSVQFADIKTVRITVVAPRPKGLTATNITTGNLLTWQKYPICSANDSLIVYRKTGCTNFQPAACLLGMPASLGYTAIARISAKDTAYLDQKIQSGIIYSYRLVATVQENKFISNQSVISNEACIGNVIPIQNSTPVMTNVTVDQTSTTAGQITVKWTRPLNFDATQIKAPYKYELFRATNVDGIDFTSVATFTNLNDTVFVDKNLNTTAYAYRYKIVFSYTDANNATKSNETAAASSVRLLASSGVHQVVLNWQALVPWNNENQVHRIYRAVSGNPTVFNKIAEVSVKTASTFSYNDDGVDRFLDDGNTSVTLSTDSTYCYKVETVGVYTAVKLGPYYNLSQVSCASPVDTTRPCPPVLSLETLDCKTLDRKQLCDPNFFKNVLKWQVNVNSSCKNSVGQYKVYYAKYKNDAFQLVATFDNSVTTFTHQRNSQDGFIGCYYVTASNPVGLESLQSNTVCNDNCPIIEFPNVFTPNGDGKNDTFAPLDCSAYLKSISVEIYNRNGTKIYESAGTSFAWDGKSTAGDEMPSGAYLYVAKVQFVRLDKSNNDTTTIKGMVELIR